MDCAQTRAFIRFRLSAMVAISSLAATLAAGEDLLSRGLLLTGGIFFLACGCSALNQVQERALDGRMERTRQRPLPLNSISPRAALLAALLMLLAGFALLWSLHSLTVSLLGLLGVLWYNGLYTWLKPRTAFAAVPGALCGALPLMMGWVAGGGALNAPPLVVLCGFMVLWQVPHFWLLTAANPADAERSRIPHILEIFDRRQLIRLIAVWIASLLCCATLLPALKILQTQAAALLLIALGLWGGRVLIRLVRNIGQEIPFAFLFSQLNILGGLILGSLLGQGLLMHPSPLP